MSIKPYSICLNKVSTVCKLAFLFKNEYMIINFLPNKSSNELYNAFQSSHVFSSEML